MANTSKTPTMAQMMAMMLAMQSTMATTQQLIADERAAIAAERVQLQATATKLQELVAPKAPVTMKEAVDSNWATRSIRKVAQVADQNVAPFVGKVAVQTAPTVVKSTGWSLGILNTISAKIASTCEAGKAGCDGYVTAHTYTVDAVVVAQ